MGAPPPGWRCLRLWLFLDWPRNCAQDPRRLETMMRKGFVSGHDLQSCRKGLEWFAL